MASLYSGGPRGKRRVGSGSGWAPRSAGVEVRLWEGRGSSCPRPWRPYGAPGLRRPRSSPHHPGGPAPSPDPGHTLTSAKDQRLRKPQLRTADSERSLSAQTPRGACREGGRSDGAPGQSAYLTAPAHHSAPSGSTGWRPTARALGEGTWQGFGS